MSKVLLIAALAAATFIGAASQAAEPAYELNGFPITRHQVAVIGAVNVREQSPVPTLMYGGMPASPSQIAILTPRRGMTSTTALARPTKAELVSK